LICIPKRYRFVLAIACLLAVCIAANGCGSSSTAANVPPPNDELVSITVTPTGTMLAKGTSQQFKAVGQFSNGSTRDLTSSATWSSSAPATVSVSASGMAKALAVGNANVMATSASITGSTSVTVSPAALVSIVISPANPSLAAGQMQQFTAAGTFSDGSMQDVTSAVTWTSSTAAVATINAAGLATTIAAGNSTIGASSGSVSASTKLTVTTATLVSITVTPAGASLPKGTTQQYTALGQFSDGSSSNLTSSVTWSSSATTFVTINAAGLAQAVSVGTANILATSGSVTGATGVSVVAPILVSLAITPANPSIAAGQTQQFTATGTFTDQSTQTLTTSVTWTSATTTVATINAAGLATSLVQGSSMIGAASGSVNTSTLLTVGPALLVSIAVTPATPIVVIGGTQQLTATGTFTDASTQNISSAATWSSSSTADATVSATGLVKGIANGSPIITAKSGSISGTDVVTVTPNPALPTGIGWHALPTATSLQGSGACPPNGFGGDPYQFADNCQNVIRTWNGAIADTTANRLIIWGGGHDNYFGNEIYSLNLIANPITLTRVKDPTVPTNFANDANCIDGIPPGSPNFAPNAREGYGGLVFLPTPNRLMILDGSLACIQGDGSSNTWTIPLTNISSSTSWVHEDPTLTGTKPNTDGDGPYGNVAAYDPNSGLVFVSDSEALYTYQYSTNKYAQITAPKGFITGIYLSGAIDPTRKLFVLVGGCSGGACAAGDGVFVADISNPASTTQQNWTTATLADPNCAEFLSGGVNPINSANPGITFDSVANDFVAWPNQGNNVYIMTPDTTNQRLTCQKLTFTGGPPNSADANDQPNTSYGTFGRLRYFPAFDAFVLVNDWNIPAYILRLR
jgi:Bacterial Ig-like domain (group 2)